MKLNLDKKSFLDLLKNGEADQRARKFRSWIESSVTHDSWQQFHDDVFALPKLARRLYLPLCFDIGVRGDSLDSTFAFYGYGGSDLIEEICQGFELLALNSLAELVRKAFSYWQNPASPMHAAKVPWLKMDEDLGDIHGLYFKESGQLLPRAGERISELGVQVIDG